MITPSLYAGRTVAVMGLGRSGQSAVRALRSAGARVLPWDDMEAARAKLETVNLNDCDFAEIDTLMWSPGIPHTLPTSHPVAERARAAGTRVVCDVEMLAEAQPQARFVGITGTNGKSTTTALIGHILKKAGLPVDVGGNLGIPALDLEPMGAEGTYVLEMSSYQLELLEEAEFDIALLLNVSPDHLGRHGGMQGYIDAKTRIFRGSSVAIVGMDDEYSRSVYGMLSARKDVKVVPISAEGVAAQGVYALDGILYDDGFRVLDLTRVRALPGRHNWQNAAAAYAAAKACGVDSKAITSAIESFPGLPHRQEFVASIRGVSFVNDSKATNADAAEKALTCYERIYWIAGGQAKEGGIVPLEPYFPRIAHAFLIGEAAPAFAQTLTGKASFTMSGDLATAVAQAAKMAAGDRGAVVLLSPACASWDQFKSFEHRGDVFRDLVRDLMKGELK
ncbi:MAG: UDP-N-acetylmuramoylalanine--D-glutamate ligase [Alphaproteobacteria bacterium RIFOXYD12_FULL_60_8]|nr:MAG: UDP-N-acetylmuramoylalanine--D-glutamate ligase [Alphaproteobacteria bacterium RIFOXYD12_FULL_60_8]